MEFKNMQGLNSINETFINAVNQFPERTALIYKEEKFTFSQLDQLVEKTARNLFGIGIRKQDKAIIYLPHMPQWIISWLALQRLGAVAVPVSHFYMHDTLNYIAKDSGAEIIFCTQGNLEQVQRAWPESSLKKIIIVDSEEDGGKEVGVRPPLEGSRHLRGSDPTIDVYSFQRLLSDGAPALPPIEINAKDLAEILYTSGTTGSPKGVPLVNAILLAQMSAAKRQSDPVIPPGQGITLQGAPLNHILGQELGLGSIISGDTLILLPHMNLDTLLEHIEKYRVSRFFGTPTLCRMILGHEKLEEYDTKCLVYVFTGGETLPVEVAKRWAEKFGQALYNGYGSTETSGGIAGIIAGRPYPAGTSGQILPDKRIKLVNPETLQEVPEGEAGELLVFSENMAEGYWNCPEETVKRFIKLNGMLWYRTGDVVQIDKDGWLFFKERSNDIIKHKGYRVGPSKIEGVLYKHDAIGGCAVVGIPDDKVGEKIKAFVVLKREAEETTAEELIDWCRERLVSYEVPHFIEFRDDLPKSQSGKILRKKLRDESLTER